MSNDNLWSLALLLVFELPLLGLLVRRRRPAPSSLVEDAYRLGERARRPALLTGKAR
ncbi:MAG: hypothetical protein OZ921_18610 [Sorangiineae bacterium]|nr:hypothetical protein [Polyangiaceae bacterium]MEB2324534.1 hypothetical protein [Sorangiineae bacterium]